MQRSRSAARAGAVATLVLAALACTSADDAAPRLGEGARSLRAPQGGGDDAPARGPAAEPVQEQLDDAALLTLELLPPVGPGWTLRAAAVEGDLGPHGGPALLLEGSRDAADDGGRAELVARDLPALEHLTLRLRVQGLADGQTLAVHLRAHTDPLADANALAHTTQHAVAAPLGEWGRAAIDYDVPPRTAALTVRLVNRSGAPLLVAAPSLRPAWVVPALPADVATLGREQAEALARSVEPVVEDLRGLDFREPVAVEVVDDARAGAYFRERLDRFWPEERRRLDEAALRQLGLWPRDLDMVETFMAVLTEQVGGFYDPDADAFFMLGDLPASTAPIIMAHELTHALDDQHHGLDDLIAAAAHDDDRAAAVGAVVEGSGTWVMGAYGARARGAARLDLQALGELQSSEMGRAEALLAAPPYLRRGLVAAYVLGAQFLQRGRPRTEVDGADIDRAFRDPPVSTEQVLHPHKYWDPSRRDVPRALEPPDVSALLGPGWSLLGANTLGELSIGLLVGAPTPHHGSPAAMLPAQWTCSAAMGWDGDRWQLYGDGSGYVTVLSTAWDDERDAVEFVAALPPRDDRHVQRRGALAVAVIGLDEARASPLARAVLAALADAG